MIINRLLQLPVHAWRLIAAPLLPPTCRFYPSCSAYALEALDRLPWWRAVGLILWRILRCQPFSKGGFDPVPPCPGHATAGDACCAEHASHPVKNAPHPSVSASSHARLHVPHG